MSDAALSTDVPGDSWQKVHAEARGVTPQEPGRAIDRMQAFNAEVRRIDKAKREKAEKDHLLAAQKKRKG